jgi:sporulation protein YlmC with PRC-barrel domain
MESRIMKKMMSTLLAGTALLAIGSAAAQQSPPPSAAPPAPAASRVAIPPAFVPRQGAGQTLARDRLIGANVHNRDGQVIGDIEDLILSPTNQVVGIIMGVGGLLGMGEKRVGVQYGALQFSEKDGRSIITLPMATKEILAAVPAYQRLQPRPSLVERGRETVRGVSDRAGETARDTATTVREKAGPAYERAKDAAGTAYERAKDAVTPASPTPVTPSPAEKK